ncbi:condensation domain-containing protein, partial [Flavobacterium araucananum]
SDLRAYLSQNIPHYMVPGFYVALDALPITSNGKVDRKALPEVTGVDIIKKEYQAPRNEIEQKLAVIWQEILALQKIGISDNFFELGGNSLLVLQVFNRIKLELGKNVAFTIFFENPTIAFLSTQLQDSEYVRIPQALVSESYPLSNSQQRFWLLSQLKGGGLAYNMSTTVQLTGVVDQAKFQQTFGFLMERHEILRTAFRTNEQGEVRQYIIDPSVLEFTIQQKDLTGQSGQQNGVADYLQQSNSIPFDLAQSPLLRASMIRLDNNSHVFSITMHHIIGDGWSIELLISEMVQVYNALVEGQTVNLPELPIQYKDYAQWQNQELQQDKNQQSEHYWLEQFAGELPVLELPGFKARPIVQTYNGESQKHSFGKELLEKLKKFSETQDVTLFMTLISGINVLLHKYSSQDDIIIGTPIAGREHPDLEHQIGLYLNTLAIRTRIQAQDQFLELLAAQKQTLLKAYDHQNYPFDLLVGKLNLKRDTSRSALFDVMVVLQNQAQLNTLNNGDSLQGLQVQAYDLEQKTSKLDLELTFVETADGLLLNIVYNTDIYGQDQIHKIFKNLENVFDQVLEQPAIQLQDITYLSEQEQHQLLVDFNATATVYPGDKTFVDLFEEQVARTPNQPAIVSADEQISY